MQFVARLPPIQGLAVCCGTKSPFALAIYHHSPKKRPTFETMAARRSARLSTSTPSSNSVKTDDVPAKAPKMKATKKEKKISPPKSAAGSTDDMLPPPASGRGGKRRASKPVPTDDSIESKGGKKKRTEAPEEPSVESSAEAVAAPKTPRKARRADPKATNAPLQTPGGTRVLKKYPTELFENSQDIAGLVTTANLLDTACRHLCSVDPGLQSVIDGHHCEMLSPKGLEEEVDPFVALCSSIISQQARLSIRFVARLT
jgi:DNA-3-methyladenine glycosylase II